MTSNQMARVAGLVWLVALIVIFVPVAALWVIKYYAAFKGCVPGPAVCAAAPGLGDTFKSALDSATDMSFGAGLLLALIAALAGIFAGNMWEAMAAVVTPLIALLFTVIGAMSMVFDG